MIQKDHIYLNARLHYTVVPGNSEAPLVLIHGQCMCGLDYEKVADKLREHYTIYLIDCFGHGESSRENALKAQR